MNSNRLLGLAVAIILGIVASMFVYRQFQAASAPKPVVKMQQIVVAAEPLKLGTRVNASNLKTIPWPQGQPVAGMFTKVDDVANRALITSVAENEPILESKLASLQSGAGLAATIPEGMRAMSVAVNDVVGVAGFVTPGTMVDVLVTGAATGGGNITRTILENVRVLAAGQKVEQDKEGKPQTVPVITLLVTPDDAAKLAMASTEGKIQLALRNTIDTKNMSPPAVMQTSLFSSGALAACGSEARCGENTSCDPRSVYSGSHRRNQTRNKELSKSVSNRRGFRMPEPSSLQLSTRNPLSVLLRAGASAIVVALLICEAPGLAGQPRVPGAARSGQQSGQQSGEVPQALHLLVGRSLVITSPSRIKRVSLADPAIAEAIVVSPTQVLVNGKAPGGVSLIIWDENEQSQAFEVSVDIDVLSLTEKIHEVFP